MKTINISEDELRRLLNERDTLNKTLADTVNRCSELLEDSRRKNRRIKVLEAEIESLRTAWDMKRPPEKPKRKVWQPPADWTPPTEEEVLELMNGPTLVNFAQKQGVKATDVLIYLLSTGMEGVNVNTRISDRALLHELLQQFPKKEAKKQEEHPIVEVATATSESLPRNAVESPHKQPPFRPVDPDPRDMVIDGGGRAWRDRLRFD